MERTDSKNDTQSARGCSRVVRYELIDKDDRIAGPFANAQEAARYAAIMLPEQQHDPDRTGVGWDIRVMGS